MLDGRSPASYSARSCDCGHAWGAPVDENLSKLAKHAATMMHFTNLVAYIASPRLVAKAQQVPSREHLLEHTDAYLAVIAAAKQSPDDPGNQGLMAAEPHARKLRDLFEQWEPSPEVPAEITQAARAMLAAAGIPEPPGGWEQFEGWPEEPSTEAAAPPSVPEPQMSLSRVLATSILGGLLVGPFQLGLGGPGGWLILDKPEIHFDEDVLIPDLAAWSAGRAPRPTEELYTTIIPDWVCEIDTACTEGRSFSQRMNAYARAGVRFMWLLDSDLKNIDLLTLNSQSQWALNGAYSISMGHRRIRGAPFDSIEIDIATLFGGAATSG